MDPNDDKTYRTAVSLTDNDNNNDNGNIAVRVQEGQTNA